jgi:hypothetical protein
MLSRRWGRLEIFSMTLGNSDRGKCRPGGRREFLGRPSRLYGSHDSAKVIKKGTVLTNESCEFLSPDWENGTRPGR